MAHLYYILIHIIMYLGVTLQLVFFVVRFNPIRIYLLSISLKIPSRKWKKNRQIQWPKDKGQTMIYKNTTQKNKDCSTRAPLKTGGERRCSGSESSSCLVLLLLLPNTDSLQQVEDNIRDCI